MAYTTIDKPSDYFNTKLYTGNGSTGQSITGVGFQPDWTWLKLRSTTGNHGLFDAVRGATKRLQANQTNAEDTIASFASFDSDGFTLSEASQNNSGETFVSWNWLGANGTASNSNGSITSTVSANTTAGFSIVSYSGSTNSTFTVGHGLGAVPKIFILKKRSSSGTNWVMYNANLGNDKRIQLNNTDASAGTSGYGNTDPTSSVFTVANGSTTGADGQTYIAYCFAEKQGYSKFGSYTGNGQNDNTFIYTGFKPAFIMIKKTDSSDGNNNWVIVDNKRLGYNVDNNPLYPNTSGAEVTSDYIDFLSNGAKIRNGANEVGRSGVVYIYMAFAENPFVTSTGIPTTAR